MADATTLELVTTLQERFRAVEQIRTAVANQIVALETRARALNEEEGHLRALLASYGALPNGSEPQSQPTTLEIRPGPKASANGPVTDNGPEVRGWVETAIDLFEKERRPIHYRILHDKLRALGLGFGGQNPSATFLSLLVREKAFSRAGRGTYWLRERPIPTDAPAEMPPAPRRRRAVRRVRKHHR